jgi:signal transduction histidine kinase
VNTLAPSGSRLEPADDLAVLEQQLAKCRREATLLRDELARQSQHLASAQAELRRLNETNYKLVSSAVYELRTPLTPLNGYVEMLLAEEMGPLTARQRESLEVVRKSISRLVAIMHELLDISRIEAGRVELVLQSVNLQRVVERAAAQCQPQLDRKSQRLIVSVAASLPPALCDENRAAQILSRLVSNASQCSPPGQEMTLRLSLAQDKGFLQISVTAHQPVAPDPDQEQLFPPSCWAESIGWNGADPVGLWQYLTCSLIELHGGRFWLENGPGPSISFHLTFPVAGYSAHSV